MKRFIEGADRGQATLLPDCLDDWIDESNPVRAVDVFVDGLDLAKLGFDSAIPEATGRPSYHPSALLKLYIYGYLNRVQSSRRLEREAGRNLEVIWLLKRLTPDDKTIADFRKDNGPAIRKVCTQFVALCREMGLLTKASVAIDGSKFKAVNTRDKNFTRGKVERRRAQLDESVARYLAQLDTADRQEPSEALAAKTTHLKEKLAKLESEMQRLAALEKLMLASPDLQISLTDPDSRSMATSGRGSGVVGYSVQVAVDTEHHLIITHEVTNSGQCYATSRATQRCSEIASRWFCMGFPFRYGRCIQEAAARADSSSLASTRRRAAPPSRLRSQPARGDQRSTTATAHLGPPRAIEWHPWCRDTVLCFANRFRLAWHHIAPVYQEAKRPARCYPYRPRS